ncbi:unnamed protein product [Sphagnum troendelagicum]|uniref:F-box domain-containing protein n=1 Tax=Sphagnum troendelagicum TaxID=128251 RepID=A0ABP0TPG4_9BRYO
MEANMENQNFSSSFSEELIPGLPEEIALACLLKVSYKCHPCLRKVCRRWEKEVTDPVFYWERRKAGATRHCVCMVQALQQPPAAETQAPQAMSTKQEKDASSAAATLYGLSMYDLEQRTWEWLPMIPEFAQEGLPFFCRVVSLHGKLVVMGGWHPSTWEALRCTYIFNFSTQTWSRGADMPRVRSFFACSVMTTGSSSSMVFVAGGHDENKTALATADVYNLDTDRWELLPDMSEERDECAGAVLDSKFFVISGYGTNSQGQFVSSADVFDPATGTWSRRNEMWSTAMAAGSSSPNGYAVARDELYTFYRQTLFRCKKTECRGLVYIPSSQENGNNCGGLWQSIELHPEFSGLAQSSCAVEV